MSVSITIHRSSAQNFNQFSIEIESQAEAEPQGATENPQLTDATRQTFQIIKEKKAFETYKKNIGKEKEIEAKRALAEECVEIFENPENFNKNKEKIKYLFMDEGIPNPYVQYLLNQIDFNFQQKEILNLL